ncbi:MAG TPA: glycosyltransferase family 2 protein [Burkholderiales bacterium]|nr:glycosyltransferase family 2 protein [Burkholderiales bacterium]
MNPLVSAGPWPSDAETRHQRSDSNAALRFLVAAAAGSAWFGLSLWLALPWIDELGGIVGPALAWFLIFGVALAPGFMNAFVVASLLMIPSVSRNEPQHLPPLTILIAAYNEAANIGATLRSIAAQRYRGAFEVIVIDDGSTDDTAKMTATGGYPWMRLLAQPANRGKAAALNRGLAEARHELIVTLDADSCLHPDALRLLVMEYASGTNDMRAVAGAVFVSNPHASWITRLQHWDYFNGIAAIKRVQGSYGGTLVAQGAFSLYERSALREIGGWPACVGEDIVVTWAIIKRGGRVGYAPDAACFTRVPETLRGLSHQRIRWGRGMIEAFRYHPDILVMRRLSAFMASWNLLFPCIDFAFTFGFIPGLVLALFGKYWLVGPATLAVIPSAILMGAVMQRLSAQVFTALDLQIRRDAIGFMGYTLGYNLILQPSSLRGYFAEVLGLPKTWGTK